MTLLVELSHRRTLAIPPASSDKHALPRFAFIPQVYIYPSIYPLPQPGLVHRARLPFLDWRGKEETAPSRWPALSVRFKPLILLA